MSVFWDALWYVVINLSIPVGLLLRRYGDFFGRLLGAVFGYFEESPQLSADTPSFSAELI